MRRAGSHVGVRRARERPRCGLRFGAAVEPAAAGRETGEDAPRCTSAVYNAQKTERRRVCYPWHALHDREVVVYAAATRRDRGRVFCCKLDEDDDRHRLEIPAWMFDGAVCSSMHMHSKPHARWESLCALHELLHAEHSHRASDSGVDRHPSSTGDADATTKQRTPPGAAKSISAAHKGAELARPRRGSSGEGHQIARTPASRSTGARARKCSRGDG